MAALAPHTGHAHVIGLTGSPGVGKSTTTTALGAAPCARAGQRVGVLAVDPSSPFSGGALLGDRVRMQDHATDPGVYIRSMASRGHLGGLSWATPQALRVLDAAGCDVVLVETVGVGQSRGRGRRRWPTRPRAARARAWATAIQAAKAGHPRDRRRVRRQQGRPRRRRRHRARHAAHDRARRAAVRPASGARRCVKTVAARGEGIDEVVGGDRQAPGLDGSPG